MAQNNHKTQSDSDESKNIISEAHKHLPITVYCCDVCGAPWATKHFFTKKDYAKNMLMRLSKNGCELLASQP